MRDPSADPTVPAAAPSSPEGHDGQPGNFLDDLIAEELRTGVVSRVATRFPPEPNGYLHIGHAKAICLNAGLAQKYGGTFNLRFDDTNPTTEDPEFVHSIQADVRWLLGREWSGLYFASDYFPQLYAWAEALIVAGKAYVDSQSTEEIRAGRGDFHRPGVDSPYRNRTVEENLDLFRRMRAGNSPTAPTSCAPASTCSPRT